MGGNGERLGRDDGEVWHTSTVPQAYEPLLVEWFVILLRGEMEFADSINDTTHYWVVLAFLKLCIPS